jgi:malate dehydrogenase
VIEARGLSSAASAANAVVDSVVSIVRPTTPGQWVSLGVISRGDYGVPEGLQFGFPVRTDGSSWEVVSGLQHGSFASEQIKATTDELVGERDEVAELLGG